MYPRPKGKTAPLPATGAKTQPIRINNGTDLLAPSKTVATDVNHYFLRKYPLDQPLLALDGVDLVHLFQAAHDWLAVNYELVNHLNVFPVPDGDTGTNLLLTIKAACANSKSNDGQTVGAVCQAGAQGALRGGRGNSGVILGQILNGLSQGLATKEQLLARDLADGLRQAVSVAYKSVPSPVEGTILTVIREISLAADVILQSSDDLRAIFAHLVAAADQAVRRTPEQLPILKKAGVVDAGGKGLFFILEGMQQALMGQSVAAVSEPEQSIAQPAAQKGQRPLPTTRWGFDVQCLIEKPNQPVGVIRQAIVAMGDCPLVEGDDQLVKIHIHVLDPGIPLSYAVSVGFVTDVVVENMDDMAAQGHWSENGVAAEVVASLEDTSQMPDEIGLVAVVPGVGFAEIFRNLGVGALVEGGQTMNPSTDELIEAIRQLPNQRVLLLPNNSNILMAANQAAQMLAQAEDPRQVVVAPSKTVPEGIASVLAFNPTSIDLEGMAAQLQEQMGRIDTGEITQAVRSAEFDGVTVQVGDFIGLHNGRLVTSSDNLLTVVRSLLIQMAADESELITIYYGEIIAQDEAENLAEIVRTHYPEQDVELAYGGQPHYHYVLSTE
jgi:DAK2 domain fusion protein YloV